MIEVAALFTLTGNQFVIMPARLCCALKPLVTWDYS